MHAAGAADHHLRRAATDVDHEHRAGVLHARRGAGEGEPGLLLTGEHHRRDAVAVADRLGEGGAVGGIAHGARHQRDGLVDADLLHAGAVLVDHLPGVVHRRLAETAVGIDAAPEAGDLRAAVDLRDPALIVDLCDQQSGRVGSDVYDADAHNAPTSLDAPTAHPKRFVHGPLPTAAAPAPSSVFAMTVTTREILFASRPVGEPTLEVFELAERTLREPGEGSCWYAISG